MTQKNTAFLTIGIITLLAFAGSYFVASQSKSRQSQPQQTTIQYEQDVVQPTDSLIQTPQETSISQSIATNQSSNDEIEGWQTYTSAEEISFKYPKDWNLSISKDDSSQVSFIIIKGPNYFTLTYTGASIYRGEFNPGYSSYSRELNIFNYGKLFVTHIGNDSEEKVAFVALLGKKHLRGVVETMSTSFPSKTAPSRWASFIGSYQPPNSEVSPYFHPDEFANKPEVKIAEKIFSTLSYD